MINFNNLINHFTKAKTTERQGKRDKMKNLVILLHWMVKKHFSLLMIKIKKKFLH